MKRLLILGLIAFLITLVIPAMAVDFTHCQDDVNGANDKPNQKDLTQFCVEGGTGSYDLWTSWNWDDTHMSGGNTADACSLYDTDNDGNVNLAVCAEWDDTQHLVISRLFNCPLDNRPENCGGAVLISTPYLSTCSVSDSTDDPFPTGDYYHHDTKATCGVDLTDFGVSDARLIDACSYPSAQPSSDASDCVLYTGCSHDADCDDHNTCTTDTCDTSIHVCRHPANTGQSCGGSTEGCDAVDTCDEQGFCNDNVASAGTLCRPSAGDCDIAELCTGSSAICPTDTFKSNSNVCRASTGVCDPAEMCTGSAAICPANVLAPSTQECRASAGVCDPAEMCTGSSATCPTDILALSTQQCRDSAGVCDNAEKCTGSSPICPTDTFKETNFVCRSGSGDMCDPVEKCTGSSATCPEDVVAYTGTICRTGSGDMCDPPEQCTGFVGQTCPTDVVNSSATICRTGSGDICDPDENCTGIAGQTCPTNIIKGKDFVCNAGSGDVCDPDEKCPGVGGQKCPSDVFASAGTVCRDGSGDICNPEEVCIGVADQSCPTDVQLPPGIECPIGECVNGQCVYVPPGGVLLPTQTTCQMYAAGPSAWPPMYDAFTYSLNTKTVKINSVSPGVIFYYNTIKAPSSSFDFTVNQVNNQGWKPMLVQQDIRNAQAYLYDTDCHIVTVAQRGSGTDPYSVQFSVTGVTAGNTYYIGIKYTPQNLVRITPTGGTSIYSWSTKIGGIPGDKTSIPVMPKDPLSLEPASSGPIYVMLT